MELNKIYCGDCLEVMKTMEDKSVDLIITDPPYGLGIDGQKQTFNKNPKHNRKQYKFMGWDKKIPSKEYFDEMFRISKNQVIWGGNYFVQYLSGYKGWLVWDKGQHGLTMSDGELAFTSFDTPLRIFVRNRVDLQRDGAVHPTQKPLSLIKWILNNFAKKDDIICDPFLGSGTTARACKDYGFNFIGIEISPEYCKIAEQRLAQEVLF